MYGIFTCMNLTQSTIHGSVNIPFFPWIVYGNWTVEASETQEIVEVNSIFGVRWPQTDLEWKDSGWYKVGPHHLYMGVSWGFRHFNQPGFNGMSFQGFVSPCSCGISTPRPNDGNANGKLGVSNGQMCFRSKWGVDLNSYVLCSYIHISWQYPVYILCWCNWYAWYIYIYIALFEKQRQQLSNEKRPPSCLGCLLGMILDIYLGTIS